MTKDQKIIFRIEKDYLVKIQEKADLLFPNKKRNVSLYYRYLTTKDLECTN